MIHTNYTGVKLNEFNIEQQGSAILSDALKGYWVQKLDSVLKLTVCRNHAMLSSAVLETEVNVSMQLPMHKPFYLHILSANGSRNVLVTNHIENLTLAAGESVQAVFLVEVSNGIQ